LETGIKVSLAVPPPDDGEILGPPATGAAITKLVDVNKIVSTRKRPIVVTDILFILNPPFRKRSDSL